MKCTYCKKGVQYGHHVSHAKNRVKRLFKPNIQKYKVRLDGEVKRVKLCTKCIKRIKRDGRLGGYALLKFREAVVFIPEAPKKVDEKVEKEKKEEMAKEKLKIEEIVGKKE